MLQKKTGGYILSKFIPVVDKHPNMAQWPQTVLPPAIKVPPRNSTGQLKAYPTSEALSACNIERANLQLKDKHYFYLVLLH